MNFDRLLLGMRGGYFFIGDISGNPSLLFYYLYFFYNYLVFLFVLRTFDELVYFVMFIIICL